MRSSPAASATVDRTAPMSHSGGFGGALDPGRGRAYESLGAEGLGGLQRVEQDQGHGLGQAGGQFGAHLADEMGAEQGQDHPGGALGLLWGVVLAAFPDLLQERLPSKSHRGSPPCQGPARPCRSGLDRQAPVQTRQLEQPHYAAPAPRRTKRTAPVGLVAGAQARAVHERRLRQIQHRLRCDSSAVARARRSEGAVSRSIWPFTRTVKGSLLWPFMTFVGRCGGPVRARPARLVEGCSGRPF